MEGKCIKNGDEVISRKKFSFLTDEKKNKNFAANKKIGAISRPKKKSCVESGHLGQLNNSGIKKNEGSSKIGKDFKLKEQDQKFEPALSVSKLNSEEELPLESNMGDNLGKGMIQPEKIASSSPIVKNSTSPRMDSKKSGEKIELVRAERTSDAVSGQIEAWTGLGSSLYGLTYFDAAPLGVRGIANEGSSTRSMTESVWALTEAGCWALKTHRRHDSVLQEKWTCQEKKNHGGSLFSMV